MPYGAVDKLSSNEMNWCSEFEHRHDQLVRVELVEDMSGWEPSDAIELARYGNIEEYLTKVEKFYAWVVKLGVLSSKEAKKQMEENKSFVSELSLEDDGDEAIDEYLVNDFLSNNYFLESPVLYLSPFKRRYCSNGGCVEYSATKFECNAMPLGQTVDIRPLERLRAVSGYEEYNSSGTPREGHTFIVTDLQEQNIMLERGSTFSWWTTTDTSAFMETEEQDSSDE